MHNKNNENINYGIITVSDSRYKLLLENKYEEINDKSGEYIKKELNNSVKAYNLIPDNKDILKGTIDHFIDFCNINCIIITGGTGISNRDNTPDILNKLYNKELPGFKIIFHKLSYNEIGLSTILSRSSAGIYKNTLIYSIPGSLGACKTALPIIKSETGHILNHLSE